MIEVYEKLQVAYHYFNKQLFQNMLPNKVFLSCQRKKGAYGYFWSQAVLENDEKVHEIAVNIEGFNRSDEDILSVLVHECCHALRAESHHLKPPKGKYHCKHWAKMMLDVGLKPISYDNPGKMTGNKVSHEIILDGPFDKSCKELLSTGFTFGNISSPSGQAKSRQSQEVIVKTCSCGHSIKTRSSYKVVCADCGEKYT